VGGSGVSVGGGVVLVGGMGVVVDGAPLQPATTGSKMKREAIRRREREREWEDIRKDPLRG
jgi:hypothetical protein